MTAYAHLWFGLKLEGGDDVTSLHEDVLNNFEGNLVAENGNGHVSVRLGEDSLLFSSEHVDEEVLNIDFQFVHQEDGPDVLIGWGIGLARIYGDASLHDIMKTIETKQDIAEIAMLEILTRSTRDPEKLEALIGRLDLYVSPDCK